MDGRRDEEEDGLGAELGADPDAQTLLNILAFGGEHGKGVSIEAIIGLGFDNGDISRDMNKYVTDLHRILAVQPEPDKIQTY